MFLNGYFILFCFRNFISLFRNIQHIFRLNVRNTLYLLPDTRIFLYLQIC